MALPKHKVLASKAPVRPPFQFNWKRFWSIRSQYPQGVWPAAKQFLFPPPPLDYKKAKVLHEDWASATGDKLVFYASFSYTDSVQDYVFYYLEGLKKHGCNIVFCTTSDQINAASLERLKKLCTMVIHRENKAFDFGSYYTAWQLVDDAHKHPARHRAFLLANDSSYGPLCDLGDYFATFDRSSCDLFGMTDSFDTYYHIQTYFVSFKNNDHTRNYLNWFFDEYYIPYDVQRMNIEAYEFGLTQLGLWKGVRPGAYLPFPRTQKIMHERLQEFGYLSTLAYTLTSQAHYFWRVLFENLRCPFIKTDLVDFNAIGLPDAHLMPTIISKLGYPIELILKNVAQKGLNPPHLHPMHMPPTVETTPMPATPATPSAPPA